MPIALLTYNPPNSGLGTPAPAAGAIINQLVAQANTDIVNIAANAAAIASANTAITAVTTTANTASTTATSANTTALAASASVATLTTTVTTQGTTLATTTTTANTATTNVGILQTNVNTLQTQVAGFGISSSVAFLSAQTGVVKTTLAAALAGTATDSLVAVQNAFNLYAGTGITLHLDAPLFINGLTDANGMDYTKSIFVPHNLQLSGDTQSMFIFNHIGTPLFVDSHTQGGTWTNVRMMYIGSPGTQAIAGQFGPGIVGITPYNFFNITLQNWLSANRGITFSGGNPYWSGYTAFTSALNLRGNVTGRVWRGCTLEVPQGANPANFLMTGVSLLPEYLPNLTVTGSFPQYGNTAVTMTSNLLGGATSFNLTAAFPHSSSHTSQITFSSGEIRVVTMSNSTGPFTISPALKYPCTSAIIAATASTPTDLWFDGCTFDGLQMGFVNPGVLKLTNHKSYRYTDLNDGTDGVMLFSGALAVGATTATLAANWYWQSGTYAPTLSSGQLVFVNLTQGSTNSGMTLGVPIQLLTQPYGNSTGGQISAKFNAVSGTYTAVLSTGATVTFTISTMLGTTATLSTGFTGTTGTYMALYSEGHIGCMSLTNGSTAVTLTATAYTPGSYTATFSTGDVRTITINSSGAVTWSALPYSSNIQVNNYITVNYPLFVAATANATCGNMGGVSDWIAPPHALYLNYGSGSLLPYRLNIDGFDDAPDPAHWVSNYPYRRSTYSGFANSSKFQVDGFTRVQNYNSRRADGGIGLLTSSGLYQGAVLQNINCTCDTSILTVDAQAYPLFSPLEFLSAPGYYYVNVTIDGATLTDLAPAPNQYLPFGSSAGGYNNKCTFKNITQVINDWNNGVYPAIEFTGNNIVMDTNIQMQSHSDTATYKGFIFVQTPSTNTNSLFDVTVSGWRLWPFSFSTTVPAGSTGSGLALSAVWKYPSGTYYVNFSDNETRWLTFTNNTTTVTAWTSSYNQPALTNSSALPASGHTAQGILMQVGNINAYRSRFGFTGAVGLNSNGVITNYRDTTNNYYLTADVNSADEQFSYSMVFTPASGATSFTTTIPLFGGFTVQTCTIYVSGTLGVTGSPSGLSVGYSGAQTALIASVGTSNGSNAFMPKSTLYLMPSTQTLTIYFVGGTTPAFGGGGTIYVSVKVAQSFQGS